MAEQLFTLKKDDAVFNCYVLDNGIVKISVTGTTTISPAAIYKYLVKLGIPEETIIKQNVAHIREMAEGKSSLKEIAVAMWEQKKAIELTPKYNIYKSDERMPLVQEGEILGELTFDGNSDDATKEKIEEMLSYMKNISWDSQTKMISAKKTGKLVLMKGFYSVLPEIDVEFQENFYKAYLHIFTMRTLTASEIEVHIAESGVVFGIDKDALQLLAMKILASVRKKGFFYIRDYLTATGNPSIPSKDGYIEWIAELPNEEVVFEEDDSGKINFKEVSLIKSVKKGETLAIVHPPVQGSDGFSVTGKKIPVEKPSKALIVAGKGVIATDNNATFISEIDGLIGFKKNVITVSPYYEVDGNVDYSTGNINFDGTVSVKNDVLTGFSVQAEKDIMINGTVEGVPLTAGGFIELKGGLPGVGKAVVKAYGDVIAKYMSEATVESGGNIIVSSSITDCDIKAYGSILASDSSIVGGKIFANRAVLCKNLGSQLGISTPVTVGVLPNIYEKYTDLEAKIISTKNEMEEVDRDLLFSNKIDPKQKEIMELHRNALSEELVELTKDQDALANGYEIKTPVYKIAVLSTVFQGVIIKMLNKKYIFKKPEKGPILIYYSKAKDEILIRPITKKEIALLKRRFDSWLSSDPENAQDEKKK